MKNLFTQVEFPQDFPPIHHLQHWLLMGSCFASEIGVRLRDGKIPCLLNPYGVLYNPLSIVTSLNEIMDGKEYGADELFEYQGLWHSAMHHGDFSTDSREETLRLINTSLREAHEVSTRLDGLLMTWGSAYVYRDVDSGRVVGNCHKLPEEHFRRSMLAVDEIVAATDALIMRLLVQNPSLKVIMTVSPIRHVRDGLHENTLSKSTLHLALHELCSRHPKVVYYFPAYEIMTDELRDYRFYADDLVHPSRMAVDYIWECFSNCFFSKETAALMLEVEKINKSLSHRPLHPESGEYRQFIRQIELKINRIVEKYPKLDFEKERELCYTRLNKCRT